MRGVGKSQRWKKMEKKYFVSCFVWILPPKVLKRGIFENVYDCRPPAPFIPLKSCGKQQTLVAFPY